MLFNSHFVGILHLRAKNRNVVPLMPKDGMAGCKVVPKQTFFESASFDCDDIDIGMHCDC